MYNVAYRDNLREILGPASELAEKYSTYPSRVALSCIYKTSLGITCLSKVSVVVSSFNQNSLLILLSPVLALAAEASSITGCILSVWTEMSLTQIFLNITGCCGIK